MHFQKLGTPNKTTSDKERSWQRTSATNGEPDEGRAPNPKEERTPQDPFLLEYK